jgi:hypothetical protein
MNSKPRPSSKLTFQNHEEEKWEKREKPRDRENHREWWCGGLKRWQA